MYTGNQVFVEARFKCDSCRTSDGCEEHYVFKCETCGKATHWSDGGDDDRPMDCSECWSKWYMPRVLLAVGLFSFLDDIL